jgi:DNA-directed RNA polymerase sigma subunit (sigma70/sigma32)
MSMPSGAASAKALRKLRHPSRADKLKSFLEGQ